MSDHLDRIPSSRAGWTAWFASLPEAWQGKLKRARLHEVKGAAPSRGADEAYNEHVYKAWVALSDAETQAALSEKGMTTLENDRGRVLTNPGFDCDPADSPLARCEASEVTDPEQLRLMERYGLSAEEAGDLLDYLEQRLSNEVQEAVMHKVRILVSTLLYHSNARLFCMGLVFAFNLGASSGFPTMTAAARYLGLTRAAVSKVTCYIRDLFELPANGHMKSDSAREAYRQAQLVKHFRKRTFGETARPEGRARA